MSRMPLVEAWRRAKALSRHPMQVPGHKMRFSDQPEVDAANAFGADLLRELVRDDIPLQGGADDNAYSNRYLEQAEAEWARAVGSDHARFLVGGSSQGNIAALAAVGRPDQRMAIDRTAHRSTQGGLIVSGARPYWIYPQLHPEFHLPIGMSPTAIDDITEMVNAVFVTSPSYVGTLSRVRELADAVHRREIPLVVDQAWGAHLEFLDGCGAIAQGADVSVTSVHKTLMGYSQTAVIAMRDSRVDRSQIDKAVDLNATTSPSATLLASIDASRALMERDGADALERTIGAVAAARRRLAQVRGLVVLDDANAGCAVDPTKLTLILPGTGTSGVDIGQALFDIGNGAETADHDTVVLTVTAMDEPAFIAELADLVAAMIESRRGEPRPASPAAVWTVRPEVVLTPREAFYGRRRRIRLDDAVGEVSAEQFCPYPPGVPLLAPGEGITQATIDAIRAAAQVGRVAYCSDPSLETIEIVEDVSP